MWKYGTPQFTALYSTSMTAGQLVDAVCVCEEYNNHHMLGGVRVPFATKLWCEAAFQGGCGGSSGDNMEHLNLQACILHGCRLGSKKILCVGRV